MRLISFAWTEPQLVDGSKTVTRRIVRSDRSPWRRIKPGDRLRGVDKAMGLRPGQKPRTLAIIEIVDVRLERVDAIELDDCAREGFPEFSPLDFVAFFIKSHGKIGPDQLVARIEFRKVEPEPAHAQTELALT